MPWCIVFLPQLEKKMEERRAGSDLGASLEGQMEASRPSKRNCHEQGCYAEMNIFHNLPKNMCLCVLSINLSNLMTVVSVTSLGESRPTLIS